MELKDNRAKDDSLIFQGDEVTLRAFIKTLPTSGGKKSEIWVRELSDSALLNWWQVNVQSEIAKDKTRADNDWNWNKLWTFRRLFSSKQPVFYALCTKGKTEPEVVLALSYCLVDEQYPPKSQSRSVFVWYLAAAPKLVLARHVEREQIPGLIGRGNLDAALVKSIAQGHSGRAWLHAAPMGGSKLIDTYQGWGMALIPLGVRIRRAGRNVNDGRYLHYDEDSSAKAMCVLDEYRG